MRYHFLALVTGLTLAVMISVNGTLAQQYGAFLATVMIHVAGTLFAYVLCQTKKTKITMRGHRPSWVYLGGVIGVLTTVFNNLSYGWISMTSIIALGVLGQTVMSLVIDGFGFFGMEKHPLKKEVLAGLALSLVGIMVMMDQSVTTAAVAAMFSFGAGVTVVLSRTVNARLSEKIGGLEGAFVNHLTGLPVSVIIALIMGRFMPAVGAATSQAAPVWAYFGGVLGVAVVFLCNVTVPKVSAFRLTLLTFIGQLFFGIVIDCIVGNSFSDASFTGGLLIAAGVVLNLILERYNSMKKGGVSS